MAAKARGRHFLKRKEADEVRARLAALLGPLEVDEPLERVTLEGRGGRLLDVILAKGEPLLWDPGDGAFLTVRGALKLLSPSAQGPEGTLRRQIVVDRGAVGPLCNGADVMAPGVVAADPNLRPGEPLVVREETHRKAIAIGRALMEGSAMVRGRGKAAENLHWVGDELWRFEP